MKATQKRNLRVRPNVAKGEKDDKRHLAVATSSRSWLPGRLGTILPSTMFGRDLRSTVGLTAKSHVRDSTFACQYFRPAD